MAREALGAEDDALADAREALRLSQAPADAERRAEIEAWIAGR
jgi:hypothetical protein